MGKIGMTKEHKDPLVVCEGQDNRGWCYLRLTKNFVTLHVSSNTYISTFVESFWITS